jgi:hypothetical protein
MDHQSALRIAIRCIGEFSDAQNRISYPILASRTYFDISRHCILKKQPKKAKNRELRVAERGLHLAQVDSTMAWSKPQGKK